MVLIDTNSSEWQKVLRRLDDVERNGVLANSSVSRGAVEIRSAEGLIVDGSMRVNGVERITGEWYLEGIGWVSGTLNIEGILNVSGTSTFSGDSIFSGTLDVTGPSKFIGEVRVEGNMNVIGNVVFDGDVAVTKKLDVTAETLLRGKTTVTADLEVAAGGKLKIGPIEFDPVSHNGSMRWGSGQEIVAQSGAIEFYSAGAVKYGVQARPDGVYIPLMERITDAGALDALDFIAYTRPSGKLVRVAQDAGSPLGGELEWPFSLDTVTSEFGPRESPGGVGSTDHMGIDFGVPMGTDIRTPGAGTVIEVGSNPGAGFGYYVTVRHKPNLISISAHMQSPPPVSVGDRVIRRQVIGQIGSTGTSTGPHLHLQLELDGTPVNPRTIITKPYAA